MNLAGYLIGIGEMMFFVGHHLYFNNVGLSILILGCFNLVLGLAILMISYLNNVWPSKTTKNQSYYTDGL